MTTRLDSHRPPELSSTPDGPMLEVHGLTVVASDEGAPVELVSDISFALHAGRTLALVGESGCGKSVTALSLLRLLPRRTLRIASGSIVLRPRDAKEQAVDVAALPERALADVRGGRIGMIFQEPMTSLNPSLTVGLQIAEPINQHLGLSWAESYRKAEELLARVRVPDARQRLAAHPHQFSGGMRQRIMIAIALACQPRLIIADEPTTALDVTVQKQILKLIREMQARHGTAMLFVTHDLGVVSKVCQKLSVLYSGKVVEDRAVSDFFAAPGHAYSKALLAATPKYTDPFASLLPVDEAVIAAVDEEVKAADREWRHV